MIILNDRDAVMQTLADASLDAGLRALIGLRVWQADTDRRQPLGDTLKIVVIQPGDPPDGIHAAVGFPLCWDQAVQPSWAWMNDHGAWFELAYRLNHDVGLLVFVADHPDTNDTLRFNCLGVADRPATDGPKP